MSVRLQGKVAVITGAGRGLGRAIARRFAEEGALLSLSDINEDAARETAELVISSGGQAIACRCDVGSESEVNNMIAATLQRFEGIDVLVNNAVYVAPPTPLEEITTEQWDKVNDSGAKGSWLCAKAALEPLKISRGRIINFGSVAGLSGAPWMGEYSAAKAACMGLTRTMALEWATHGINVNAVAPAALTPGVQTYFDQVQESAAAGASADDSLTTGGLPLPPLGRMGDPYEDIAPAVLFLASEDAHFITGQTLCVDGGLFRL